MGNSRHVAKEGPSFPPSTKSRKKKKGEEEKEKKFRRGKKSLHEKGVVLWWGKKKKKKKGKKRGGQDWGQVDCSEKEKSLLGVEGIYFKKKEPFGKGKKKR